MLVTNVTEVERAPEADPPESHDDESHPVRQLRELHDRMGSARRWRSSTKPRRRIPKASTCTRSGSSTWSSARIDDLFYAIAHAVKARLTYDEKSHRDLLDELNERLVDKYFVNFSVFESMPDVWAIDQVFPIVPIERLDERRPGAA